MTNGGLPFEQPILVNYNDLTATSLEMMVNKGNHQQMALIQVGEVRIIYPEPMTNRGWEADVAHNSKLTSLPWLALADRPGPLLRTSFLTFVWVEEGSEARIVAADFEDGTII